HETWPAFGERIRVGGALRQGARAVVDVLTQEPALVVVRVDPALADRGAARGTRIGRFLARPVIPRPRARIGDHLGHPAGPVVRARAGERASAGGTDEPVVAVVRVAVARERTTLIRSRGAAIARGVIAELDP